MVFSSPIFLFYFLPVALGVYFALFRARQRTRNLCLALLGYFFYGWADPRFIFLMFGTTFIDWMASLVIAHNTWRLWNARESDVPNRNATPRPNPFDRFKSHHAGVLQVFQLRRR
jgi:D-alanyl-lipoteichoic acid acyltransferase DltB (MBOAT superfamily)